MKIKTQMASNVKIFLEKASEIIGEFETKRFNSDKWNECRECGFDSPIEQIVYIAFETLRKINCLDILEPHEGKHGPYLLGTGLDPGKKVGNYIVDFLATHAESSGNQTSTVKEVGIECDSQEFHERSEAERRYEKKRDRFLASKGLHVLHFTGSEIVGDPFKVAAEILAYLTGQEEADLIGGDLIPGTIRAFTKTPRTG
jgi:very-short-patch-repair endonuclease